MSLLTAFALSLAVVTKVRGLAPAVPNLVVNVPSSSTSPSVQPFNISNTANGLEFFNVTSGRVICDGRQFGSNLNQSSCQEAWGKIPTDFTVVQFGARGHGTFERPLPYRYLSDDGLCAVDIIHGKGATSDTAANHDISAAARTILDKCVFRHPRPGLSPVGGALSGVGSRSGLTVKVSSYSPTVKCAAVPTPPDEAACSALVGDMLIAHNTCNFLRRILPFVRNVVIVPVGGLVMPSASGACTGVIDFEEGERDKSSWLEMWKAAVAVNEMCVRKGKTGTASKLGQDMTLMLSLR